MIIIMVLPFLPTAGALQRPRRTAPTGNGVNSLNTSSLPYIEVLRGRDGRDGRDGVSGLRGPQGQKGQQGVSGPRGTQGKKGQQGGAGPPGPQGQKGQQGGAGPPGPRNGGVVYTRWGKTTCPNVTGTELVYAGRTGGSWYGHTGGGANYLCMPSNPDYLQYRPGVQGHSYVYGTEYETQSGGPLSTTYQHNAPCAVCYASLRVAITMIPAKIQCPSTWTREYSGYLMSTLITRNHYRTMFECVDRNPDTIAASALDTNGAVFYHVEANCNGMACPPYDPQKELTCIVCTK